jgi:WD40 repeat protein
MLNMECVQVGQLGGHKGVLALALLSEGRLASASWDHTIRIWDIASQLCVGTLRGHVDSVISLAVLSNGQLASGSTDNSIRIWNTATLECVGTLQGLPFSVHALAAMSGGVLASSCGPLIAIWDVSTQERVSALEGHTSLVLCLAILPTGQIVSGSYDSEIRIWCVFPERCDFVLQGHTDSVVALSVLPTGHLASGSYDKTIRIWNLSSLRCEFTLQGHKKKVYALACLQSGHLVSGSEDESMIIWDINTGVSEVVFPAQFAVSSLISLSASSFAASIVAGTILLLKCKFPPDQLTISDIVSSSLFTTSYTNQVLITDPGRSFRKQFTNIWYNINGAANWIHSLRGHYVQQCRLHHVLRVNSSPSAVDFEKYFVNLALIRHIDHISREKGLVSGRNVAAMSLDRGELYDRLFLERRYCAVETIFGELEDRNQGVGWIKIIGRAGTGKTTLTHFLAYRWGQKASLWDNRFDAVFRVKLNLVTQDGVFEQCSSAISCLVALIAVSLERTEVLDRKMIRYFLEKCPSTTLLLLDGYDEIASLYCSNIRVKGLVDHAFSLPNGILTSRPMPFPTDWSATSVFKQTYENIGLSEQNVVRYVEQYYAGIDRAAKGSLLETLQRNPNLMKLAQIPVNLNAMCNIWQEESKEDQQTHRIVTMTGVYDRMVLAVLRHAKLKKSPDATKYELSDDFLRKENSLWLCELSRLAYNAFEADQTQTIGPDLLRMYLDESMVDSVKLLNVFRVEWGLLREAEAAPALSASGLSAHYFVHLTYQEYFVALHFVNALIPSEPKEYVSERRDSLKRIQALAVKISANRQNPRYEVIWTFVAGLLSRSPYLEYADYYWDALLPYEAENPNAHSCSPNFSCSSSSAINSAAFLGVHPTSSTVSTYGRLIREAVFGIQDRRHALPRRLSIVLDRLKLVLQWQLVCEDRGLVALGDQLTDSMHEIQWKLKQHEGKKRQLLVDLERLGGSPLNVTPWSMLCGYKPGHMITFQETPDVFPELAGLTHKSKWMRLETIRQLACRPCSDSVDKLLHLADSDSDISVRAMALISWCLQMEAANDGPQRALTEILETNLKTSVGEMRRSTVLLVGTRCMQLPSEEQRETLGELRTIMKHRDENPHTKLLCAKLLVLIDNDLAAFHQIVEALRYVDANLRLEALVYLTANTGRLVDKTIVAHLLTTIQEVSFDAEEQSHLADALRRIRPELYASVDSSLFSSGIVARGFIESLWIHMGTSVCSTPELRRVEDELIATMSSNAELVGAIQALREPLTLPLVTTVFEASFVDDTLQFMILSDELCVGNASLGTSVVGLNHCCDSVQGELTLERAMFGPGPCLTCDMKVPGVSVKDVRQAVVDCGNFVDTAVASIPVSSTMDRNHILAIRLYTLETPPIYKLLNYPFYNPDNRNANSVLNQLPYMKYLLQSFDAVCACAQQLIYTGPAFRGVSITISELLERKYRNWQTEYVVGRKLTFPSFTSVSLDMTTAERFAGKGERVIFQFSKVSGLRLKNLSAMVEQEVLLKPPAVFTIHAVAMEANKTLSLTLEMDLSSPLTYL